MANFEKDIFTKDEKEAWIIGNKIVNVPNLDFELQSNSPEFYRNIIEKKSEPKPENKQLKMDL